MYLYVYIYLCTWIFRSRAPVCYYACNNEKKQMMKIDSLAREQNETKVT